MAVIDSQDIYKPVVYKRKLYTLKSHGPSGVFQHVAFTQIELSSSLSFIVM